VHRYYFAYGSNMNPKRVAGRQMDFASHFSGRLDDYRLAFNKRSVKHPGAASANVVHAPGDYVEGVVYELTAPEQIETMDPFEGYPRRYLRHPMSIDCEAGSVLAWVYMATQEYVVDGLRPAKWYLEHLLAGRPYLSDDYYQTLSQVECLPESELEPA
jgi:gamma-glutamylcyclotransferase (GGCT)/AIG2-like uncharacterized protein YtfP